MLAFNHWFDAAIVRQGVDDVEGFNRRSIHLAESRIDLVVAALAELKRSGVDGCSPSQLLALRKANFSAPWVKEFSIIAADGQTLCSDLGLPLQPRAVVSSYPAKTAGVTLDVVRMGSGPGAWFASGSPHREETVLQRSYRRTF